MGGFLGRHHRWARECGVPANDRSIHENRVPSLAFHHAATWDRYNVANGAAFEVLARRLQLIEE
eukprot:252960-Alexandrium_andersonii.AAC.1